MILTRHYSLGMYPGESALVIRSSWKATASRIVLSLYAGENGVLSVPSDASVVILGKTCESGTPIKKEGELSFSDAGVPLATFDLDADMLAELGMNEFEVVILSGDYCLVSDTFLIDVQ